MHHRHHHHHHGHRRGFHPRGAALMALGLGLAAGIFGCSEDREREEPRSRVDDLLGRLDATEAEREALRPLLRDLAADLDAVRARTAALRADVLDGWRTDTLDPARLRERADIELEALRETANRLSERIAVLHAAMTPAQREQLTRAVTRWRH